MHSRCSMLCAPPDCLTRETASATLIEAIQLTSEICGRPLTRPAATMLAQDLSGLDQAAVLAALARCRLELQGPISMAEILLRLEDGRPDTETAWEMLPRSEAQSVVWTNEMVLAWSAALPQLVAGDDAGALAVFSQAYRKALLQARMRREPAQWLPSLGSDPAGRRRALLEALEKRRLTQEHINRLLPETDASGETASPASGRNLH